MVSETELKKDKKYREPKAIGAIHGRRQSGAVDRGRADRGVLVLNRTLTLRRALVRDALVSNPEIIVEAGQACATSNMPRRLVRSVPR